MMFRDPKQKNMLDMFSQNVQDPASYFDTTSKVDPNRVQAIKNKMSDEQMQTIASRNKLNKEIASGGIIDNSGPIEEGQLGQTLESRDKLNKEISSGGIIDKSGPIGEGMVESGKMTQDEFDKSFKTEDMDKSNGEDALEGLSQVANALKSSQKEDTSSPVTYNAFRVDNGISPVKNNMEARRNAIARLSGGGVF